MSASAAEVDQLRDLLRQAIEFDGETVSDARAVRKWKYAAMEAVGGYNMAAMKRSDRYRDAFLDDYMGRPRRTR